MKKIKKTGLVLLSLGLVLAFSSMAWAESEFTAVKVQSLSAEEARTMYEGVEIKPMPLPKLKRPDVGLQAPAPHVGTPIELMVSPSNIPADAAVSEYSKLEPQPQVIGCPPSFWVQIFDVDYTMWPTRVVGKLIFTGIDGGSYMCTASVVSQNVVLTAGHCVMTNGWLHSGFVFTPGYYYGPTLYGTWSANTIIYFNAWANSEDYRYDVAFMIMNTNGGYVGDLVGWLGFAAGGDPTTRTWDQYGYPWNLADAQAMARVTSSFGMYDPWFGYPTNPTIGVGSNMLGGSSGGPWVWYADDVYANGLNSYGYDGCPETMFGPYFDQSIWDAFLYALSLM